MAATSSPTCPAEESYFVDGQFALERGELGAIYQVDCIGGVARDLIVLNGITCDFQCIGIIEKEIVESLCNGAAGANTISFLLEGDYVDEILSVGFRDEESSPELDCSDASRNQLHFGV